jgi:hypothetical protein
LPIEGEADTYLSPDGQWRLIHNSVSLPWTLQMKAVETGRVVWKREPRAGELLTFSPHGRLILGSAGKWVEVRETATDCLVGRPMSAVSDPGTLQAQGLAPGGWTIALSVSRYQVSPRCSRRIPLSRVFLLETLTGQVRRRLPELENVSGCVFTRDGRYLITTGQDGTALVWKTYPAEPSRAVRTDQLWAELADNDAGKAFAAITRLIAMPGPAVKEIGRRLRPANPTQVSKWLADLDDDSFHTREEATRQLAALGDAVEMDLRGARKGASLEVRMRLARLLAPLEKGRMAPARLQRARALEVLAHLGTPEARRLLHKLAAGASGSRLTHEARAMGTEAADLLP